MESEPSAATLTGPSSRGSESKLIKKKPFPWAQFSIVLFLQLAEPLTLQAIYPVSLLTGFFLALFFDRGRRGSDGFAVRALNDPFIL